MAKPMSPDPLVRQDPPLAKVPRQFLGLLLGYDAMLMDDAQKVLKADREATKASHLSLHGQNLKPEADDMGVHVGDAVTHVHNPPAKSSGISKLAAASMVAAALAAGGLAMNLYKPAVPVAEKAKPAEFIIKWSVEEGKVKTTVTPVKEKE